MSSAQASSAHRQPPIQHISRQLGEIAPQGVALHVAVSAPHGFTLAGSELDRCERFSSSRLSAFKAGRYCAAEALNRLGCERVPVPIGSYGQPVWPSHIVGSIAHTKGLAGAIAADGRRYAGLGLDLEHLQPITDVARQICTTGELKFLRSHADIGHYLNIIFSAKEAVYKCLWPLVRRFVSFTEVEIAVDYQKQRFRVAWHAGIHPLVDRISGRWDTLDGTIATVAVLERSPAGDLT